MRSFIFPLSFHRLKCVGETGTVSAGDTPPPPRIQTLLQSFEKKGQIFRIIPVTYEFPCFFLRKGFGYPACLGQDFKTEFGFDTEAVTNRSVAKHMFELLTSPLSLLIPPLTTFRIRFLKGKNIHGRQGPGGSPLKTGWGG